MTNCGNIPEGLRNIPQWLFASNRPGKEKAPCNESGKPIDATDPSTWHTFDEVSTHLDSAEFDSTLLLHYPGFSFSPSDPYIFIDVDLYRIQNENVRIIEDCSGNKVNEPLAGEPAHNVDLFKFVQDV